MRRWFREFAKDIKEAKALIADVLGVLSRGLIMSGNGNGKGAKMATKLDFTPKDTTDKHGVSGGIDSYQDKAFCAGWHARKKVERFAPDTFSYVVGFVCGASAIALLIWIWS